MWVALLAPIQPQRIHTDAFVRLPIEALAIVALALALPDRGRRLIPFVAGPLLGLLVLVKLLDAGFLTAFDRPFNPVEDWGYASFGAETLRSTLGRTRADLVEAGLGLTAIAALVLPTVAVRRTISVAAGHPLWSRRVVAALGGAWLVCWALAPSSCPARRSPPRVRPTSSVQEVRAVNADLNDAAIFAAQLRHDRYHSTPGNQLLTALRGKDVLLVFVESYGKVAVEGSSFSPHVDAVLHHGTQLLKTAGSRSRSGWLTSPTFGGLSWLAHSTMQSGAWVDRASRYDELMASHRFTLSQAFKRAGWRVIDDVPPDDRPWPQGNSFYHFDRVYNRKQVGYHGPTYAFASMPDQYTYLALQRLELAKTHRRPLFAEIDTVSSHIPWTRVPPMIPWNEVGDGSIFKTLPVDKSGVTDVKTGVRPLDRVLAARAVLVHPALWPQEPGVDRAWRPPAGSRHHRIRRRSRRAGVDHRPDPRCCPDLQLGLGGRHAPHSDGARVADERVPQQVPRGVRPAAGEPVARHGSVGLEPRRQRVAQQHDVSDLGHLGERRAAPGVPGKAAVAHEPGSAGVADEHGSDNQLQLVDEVVGQELGVHLAAALDHQPLHAAGRKVAADPAHLHRVAAVHDRGRRLESRAGIPNPGVGQ